MTNHAPPNAGMGMLFRPKLVRPIGREWPLWETPRTQCHRAPHTPLPTRHTQQGCRPCTSGGVEHRDRAAKVDPVGSRPSLRCTARPRRSRPGGSMPSHPRRIAVQDRRRIRHVADRRARPQGSRLARLPVDRSSSTRTRSPCRQQRVDQMRPDEARPAGDQVGAHVIRP